MQNLFWKTVLILVIVGGCLWATIPPDQRIRLGRDLSGGVSLVYSVRIPENADRNQILNQTIRVLNDRVNPQGVLDIAMTPLGADRIEIVMPLPNDEVKSLAQAYEVTLQRFIDEAEIDRSQLESTLDSHEAATRFGGNEASDRGQLILDLQEAYDTQRRLQIEAMAAETAGTDPAELGSLQQQLADAEIDYEELFEEAIALSLDRSRVVRALELSNVGEPLSGDDGSLLMNADGSVKRELSPREVTMQTLVSEYPHLGEVLDEVIVSYDAYQAKRSGLDDPEDLMRLLRGAGVLEFHIAVTNGRAEGVNIQDIRAQLVELGPQNTDSMLARWYPIHDLEQWASTPDQLQALQANPETYFASPGRDLVATQADGVFYLLLYTSDPKSMTHRGEVDWTVQSAGRTTDSFGRPAVNFRLDQAGGQMMSRLTQPHVQQPMAIVLDDKVYTAPNLNSQIANTGVITGSFTDEDIDYLTRVLVAGALEARLSQEPISVNVLGPSIGADNLGRGFDAFLWAICAVAVFMLCWYFFAGMVANFALLCNGIIIFGVMALLQGTFTLPGLAGVVLTMGMAVDANVLIYERIREELEGGARDLREAIREGYNRVYSTIIDANLTNLIVCAVLLLMQPTTEVKGFALTLTIGIIATLFTSLFVTRYIFDLYAHVMRFKKLPMLPIAIPAIGRILHPKINWIGMRGFFWTASILLVGGSIVLFYVRGVDMFDTEFRGGVAVTMKTAPNESGTGNLMLGHNGEGSVQSRVKAIADNAGEGDGLHDRVLRELRNAKVLTVGTTGFDAQGNTVADSFQVKVANPSGLSEEEGIQDIVERALLEEFGSQLAVSEPRGFRGDNSDAYADFTRPIEAKVLSEVLDGRGPGVDISDHRGGVLILLEDIQPPISLEDVTQRIDQMRQDPDFSRDTAGRDVQVYGLASAGGDDLWGEVAVVVTDPDFNYLRSEAALVDQRLALREWQLVQTAMTKRSSFEQVSSFSPSVAQTRAANAIGAVILSLAGILCYIWIRFGSFYYSLGAIVALCHDVIIVLGCLALSGFLAGYEWAWRGLLIDEFLIDTGVVAALLTVIGYSLNDTIVILDRIRENRGKQARPSQEVVNNSINQAFSRTILTSVTTAIAVLIIYVAGGTGIRAFGFALFIGVLVGTYSSVAIASPLVYRRSTVRPDPELDEGSSGFKPEEDGAPALP